MWPCSRLRRHSQHHLEIQTSIAPQPPTSGTRWAAAPGRRSQRRVVRAEHDGGGQEAQRRSGGEEEARVHGAVRGGGLRLPARLRRLPRLPRRVPDPPLRRLLRLDRLPPSADLFFLCRPLYFVWIQC